MSHLAISACTISDAATIGRNNIAAFWTDPTWIRMWPGKTREYVAEQAALRMARTLATDLAHRRHLKAVDAASGEILGYARWQFVLAPGQAQSEDEGEARSRAWWPEAVGPQLSEAQMAEANAQADSADWEFDTALDVLDPPMLDMKKRHTDGKEYMSSCQSSGPGRSASSRNVG